MNSDRKVTSLNTFRQMVTRKAFLLMRIKFLRFFFVGAVYLSGVVTEEVVMQGLGDAQEQFGVE